MASPEVIVGGVIAAVGALAMLLYASGRLEQSKQGKTRAATTAAREIVHCFRIIDNVPTAYLPGGVGNIVVKSAQALIARLGKLAPAHADLSAHAERLQALEQQMATNGAATTRPPLTPEQRKETSSGLRDLKRLALRAEQQALISRKDCQGYHLTIDAVLLRILVDHLKINAFNSEAIDRRDDAVRYMQRAIDALSTGNDAGRYTEEIVGLRAELARAQGLIRAAVEQRRANALGPNELLRGLIQEEKRDAAERKPAQYD